MLSRLDATRDAAFGAGDLAALGEVYAPGCAPLATDRRALQELLAHHVHARELDLSVVSVLTEATSADRLTLHVVDRLSAYDVVDGRGHVVVHRPGRGPQAWSIDLTRSRQGWRIARVAASGR